MTINVLLDRLQNVKPRGKNTWMACCPAHDDKSPSLAIKYLQDGRILMKCFAGCDVISILTAVQLCVGDLFPDRGLGEYESFERLKQAVRKPDEDKYFQEKAILALADSDREAGKRLSMADLTRERQAYLTLRKNGILPSEAS